MGYASYEITRNGQTIQAGYAIEAVCEQGGCTERIDRGLDYLCGATSGGDDYGCGGYFCGGHLFMSTTVPVDGLCGNCSDCHDADED